MIRELHEYIGYDVGSDLTLLNTIYTSPKRDESTGRWSKGIMTLIFRDNSDGTKHHVQIEDPEYEYYITKPNVYLDHQEMFYPESKLDRVLCKYSELEKDIAERTNNMEFYMNNIKCGNRIANKELHKLECVFSSDMHIEDKYRLMFSKTYTNSSYELKKAYIDIEIDMIDDPHAELKKSIGLFPIDAVTYVDCGTNSIHTFLLRNSRNPQIQEFEQLCASGAFSVEMKEFVKNHVGGWKNEIRFKLQDMSYHQYFYDEEIQLIQDIFILINHEQPDFVMAWNMEFDIPYIIERIKYLGYDPKDIMCDPSFKHSECYYYIDTRASVPEEKGDYCVIMANTVYVDQLIHFASRRKGQSKFPNNKLDTIGEIIAGIGKLDWSHLTTVFAEFKYIDYKLYVMYNIMDTLVQHCVEVKTDDIGYLFNKALMNNSRYNKAHRQTVYLINRGAVEFRNEDGMILGNNMNKSNPKPTAKFPGAFVGDPTRIHPSVFIQANGKPTRVYNNGDDYDYASLYPSLIHEFNIAPNTQIGKVFIPEKVFENENPYNNDAYDRGGNFLDDMQSQNWIQFCSRWFGVSNFKSLLDDVYYYLNNIKMPFYHESYLRDGSISPVAIYKDKDQLIDVVRISQEKELDAVVIHAKAEDMDNALEGIEYEKIFYETV